MRALSALRRAPRFIINAIYVLFGLGFMVFGLRYSTLPLYDQWTAIAVMARDAQFDYASWEINAISVKVYQTLYGLHPFMTEQDRSQYVRDYMAGLGEAQFLEGQIANVFSDPNVDDPLAASAELRTRRDALRRDLEARQPMAEAILEGQVAAVLQEEGFGWRGQILPPVSAHFTQVPNLLIVSPRNRISFDVSINLDPMPIDEQVALEEAIDAEHNVSSLTVPLGGIALYPAMILETASIPYAAEVIAHEWLHHYLIAFPLGYAYDFEGEARIINETTASYFGQEIGRKVVARYYPELVPRPAPPAPQPSGEAPVEPAPPRFNFAAEMNETRVHVDELLAEGRVEDAEAYMEERRELFVANGYVIRKLNQAFFAFYGGYQSPSGGGAGGRDPIGPSIRSIRTYSDSLHDWVVTMRSVITREQLLALVANRAASRNRPD